MNKKLKLHWQLKAGVITEAQYQKKLTLLEAEMSISEPTGLAILGAPAGGKSYTMDKIKDIAKDARITRTLSSGITLTVDKLRAEFQSQNPIDQLKAFVAAFYLMKTKAKEDPKEFGKWFADISKLWTEKFAKEMPELEISVEGDQLLFQGKPADQNFALLDKIDGEKVIGKLDKYNDYKRVVRYFQDMKQGAAIAKRQDVSYDEAGDEPTKIVGNMNRLHNQDYVTDVFLIHPENVASNLIQNYFRVIKGSDGGRDSSSSIIQAYNDIEKSKDVYAKNAEKVVSVSSKELGQAAAALQKATTQDDDKMGDKPIDVFVQVAPMTPEEAYKTFIDKLDKEQQQVFTAMLKFAVKALPGVPDDAKGSINQLTSGLSDNEVVNVLKKAAANPEKYKHQHGGVDEKIVAKAAQLFGGGDKSDVKESVKLMDKLLNELLKKGQV
jgi:hypothetical protein